VIFGSTLNGAFDLTVNSSGLTVFGAAVGGSTPLASLTTDVAGATQINGNAVATTGAQTYNDPVILGANTALSSSGAGNITWRAR